MDFLSGHHDFAYLIGTEYAHWLTKVKKYVDNGNH